MKIVIKALKDVTNMNYMIMNKENFNVYLILVVNLHSSYLEVIYLTVHIFA